MYHTTPSPPPPIFRVPSHPLLPPYQANRRLVTGLVLVFLIILLKQACEFYFSSIKIHTCIHVIHVLLFYILKFSHLLKWIGIVFLDFANIISSHLSSTILFLISEYLGGLFLSLHENIKYFMRIKIWFNNWSFPLSGPFIPNNISCQVQLHKST